METVEKKMETTIMGYIGFRVLGLLLPFRVLRLTV